MWHRTNRRDEDAAADAYHARRNSGYATRIPRNTHHVAPLTIGTISGLNADFLCAAEAMCVRAFFRFEKVSRPSHDTCPCGLATAVLMASLLSLIEVKCRRVLLAWLSASQASELTKQRARVFSMRHKTGEGYDTPKKTTGFRFIFARSRMSHAATTGCANCTATSARFHSRLQRFCASVGHPACMADLAKHYLLMKSAKPGVGHPGNPSSSQQQGRRLFPGLKIAVRAGGPCRARWSRQRFALHKMCCIPQSVRAAAQRTARWLG